MKKFMRNEVFLYVRVEENPEWKRKLKQDGHLFLPLSSLIKADEQFLLSGVVLFSTLYHHGSLIHLLSCSDRPNKKQKEKSLPWIICQNQGKNDLQPSSAFLLRTCPSFHPQRKTPPSVYHLFSSLISHLSFSLSLIRLLHNKR